MTTQMMTTTSCPGHIPVPLREDGSIHKAAYRELKHFGVVPDFLEAEVAEWVPNTCSGACTDEETHEADGGNDEGVTYDFEYPLNAEGGIDKSALREMRPHRRVRSARTARTH